MRRYFLLPLLFFAIAVSAQTDSTKWLRAFPITDYMVDLSDTVKVVQLEMPEGVEIKENQLGLMYGKYSGDKANVVQKGFGRCHLIKGSFYYFAIHHDTATTIKAGDLLYTFMDKPAVYDGFFTRLAAHFIRLQDVNGNNFYDRYTIFNGWSESEEENTIDSIQKDIRYTGKYFLEQKPGMDQPITTGFYQGGKILSVMAECTTDDIKKFLQYVLDHPRLYAGNEWKVTEIFATWLKHAE
jgi:hypothetical protein